MVRGSMRTYKNKLMTCKQTVAVADTKNVFCSSLTNVNVCSIKRRYSSGLQFVTSGNLTIVGSCKNAKKISKSIVTEIRNATFLRFSLVHKYIYMRFSLVHKYIP